MKCCKSTPHGQSHAINSYVKRNQYRQAVHQLELEEPEYSVADDTYHVDVVELIDVCVDTVNPRAENRDEGFVTLQVHNKLIEMKVDTGVKMQCNIKRHFQSTLNGANSEMQQNHQPSGLWRQQNIDCWFSHTVKLSRRTTTHASFFSSGA